MEQARWAPDPETQAALKTVVTTLTQPESDGYSMVERAILTCHHKNQRDKEIRTAGFALLEKRFPGKSLFFHADISDYGRCSFSLRVARKFDEIHTVQPASEEYFVNLLRDRSEWVVGPKVKPAPKPTLKRAKAGGR